MCVNGLFIRRPITDPYGSIFNFFRPLTHPPRSCSVLNMLVVGQYCFLTIETAVDSADCDFSYGLIFVFVVGQ